MGGAIVVLAAVPALNWARTGAAYFPVFEVFMLTNIPFYGISLLAGPQDDIAFSDKATLEAAVAMLVYQVCAVATFMRASAQPSRSPMLTSNLIPPAAMRFAQTGLWVNSAYLYINGFTDYIPSELKILAGAIFSGVGIVSLFVEMRLWGAGELTSGGKGVVVLNLLIQLLFLFRDLYLIAGLSLFLLALVGYTSTSRRVPIAVIALVLPIIAILHNGKSAMRHQYWESKQPMPGLTELPAFFQQWFERGLSKDLNEGDPTSSNLAGRLLQRASLFQMLCLVTERTPDPRPFLSGESYLYIPAQLIPSFLWPDKPSSMLSNVLLAIHYRLVPEDNPTNVSIAFGMVAESYANFGIIGNAAIGILLGLFYKRVTVAGLGASQFSALGLLTILLGAWSFQVEQILATWLVSLLQASIVVIGVPLAVRILFRPE